MSNAACVRVACEYFMACPNCSQILEFIEVLTFSSHRRWAENKYHRWWMIALPSLNITRSYTGAVHPSFCHDYLQNNIHDVFSTTQTRLTSLSQTPCSLYQTCGLLLGDFVITVKLQIKVLQPLTPAASQSARYRYYLHVPAHGE